MEEQTPLIETRKKKTWITPGVEMISTDDILGGIVPLFENTPAPPFTGTGS